MDVSSKFVENQTRTIVAVVGSVLYTVVIYLAYDLIFLWQNLRGGDFIVYGQQWQKSRLVIPMVRVLPLLLVAFYVQLSTKQALTTDQSAKLLAARLTTFVFGFLLPTQVRADGLPML